MVTKAIKSAAGNDFDDEDVVKGGLAEEICKRELPLSSIAEFAGKDGESHNPLPVLLLQKQQVVPTANWRCVLLPGRQTNRESEHNTSSCQTTNKAPGRAIFSE